MAMVDEGAERPGFRKGPDGEWKSIIQETDEGAIRIARGLLRTARHGALGVIEPETGAPFVSRAGVATMVDGTPLVLASTLAAHTGAMVANPRVSLMVGTVGKGDPLAHPRISIACRAAKLERSTPEADEARRRYLNRNPKARLYADFPDFSFFRLDVEGASLNGGFGKAFLFTRAHLVLDGPAVAAIATGEQSALEHMNADHADAVEHYARTFAGAEGGKWRIVGIDPEGIDIASGDSFERVPFPEPVADMTALRKTLVAMAAR